jgi:hypothetical protein
MTKLQLFKTITILHAFSMTKALTGLILFNNIFIEEIFNIFQVFILIGWLFLFENQLKIKNKLSNWLFLLLIITLLSLTLYSYFKLYHSFNNLIIELFIGLSGNLIFLYLLIKVAANIKRYNFVVNIIIIVFFPFTIFQIFKIIDDIEKNG